MVDANSKAFTSEPKKFYTHSHTCTWQLASRENICLSKYFDLYHNGTIPTFLAEPLSCRKVKWLAESCTRQSCSRGSYSSVVCLCTVLKSRAYMVRMYTTRLPPQPSIQGNRYHKFKPNEMTETLLIITSVQERFTLSLLKLSPLSRVPVFSLPFTFISSHKTISDISSIQGFWSYPCSTSYPTT